MRAMKVEIIAENNLHNMSYVFCLKQYPHDSPRKAFNCLNKLLELSLFGNLKFIDVRVWQNHIYIYFEQFKKGG